MNIYFDFEATQYSEQVIAIGATCDVGDFDCLVNPADRRHITEFITALTGITKDMCADAPTPLVAFTDLYQWLAEITKNIATPVFYHCYGNMDKIYLQHTANNIESLEVKNFILNLSEALIDDSIRVCKHFHAHTIGVHKALEYFEPNLSTQTHDPLDDAILLKRLMEEHILSEAPVFEPVEIKNATRKGFHIEAIHKDPKAKVKIFSNIDQAADWCYQRLAKKDPGAHRTKIIKKAQNIIANGGTYCGRTWKIVEE